MDNEWYQTVNGIKLILADKFQITLTYLM
jgi:hypothetical protein